MSRELARNCGRRSYLPSVAAQAAWQRSSRPKACKLALNPALREHVVTGLVQAKGLLSKELTKELRSRRGVRRAGRLSVRDQSSSTRLVSPTT